MGFFKIFMGDIFTLFLPIAAEQGVSRHYTLATLKPKLNHINNIITPKHIISKLNSYISKFSNHKNHPISPTIFYK